MATKVPGSPASILVFLRQDETLPVPILPSSPENLMAEHVLYIAEILEMILDQLGDDKCSMSRLALACKTISEPALDRLWALNNSLEPFLPLLPEELTLDDNSFFQFDPHALLNLPSEKWATFDKYARRARHLYAKTVTMIPHRVYSSIYKQLTDIRPNVELFPNLITLAFHAKSAPKPQLRMFPSSLRSIAISWGNATAPKVEAVLWSSLMNRLLLDAPLVEHIYFEGSPKEPLLSLTLMPFQRLQKVTIRPSPLDPNVLHKYCHAFSASAVREVDLRFGRWPDSRFYMMSPVFPSLEKLTIDGCASHAIELVQLLSSPVFRELTIVSQERLGCDLNQYAQLLVLLADKYRGVFRTLKIQHSLQCRDQTTLESFLFAARAFGDAGVRTLQLNLILGWQDLTREVQEMIEPSKWVSLSHFRILSRRPSALW